jgi:hypothetical protein
MRCEMMRNTKKILSLFLIVSLGGYSYVYSQEPPQIPELTNVTSLDSSSGEKSHQTPIKIQKITCFLNWINTRAYAATIDKKAERKRLRIEWQKMLGIDIFSPYFKAKEVESWVKEKAKVNFFNIKGKPEFDRDQIQYIFKIKF